MQVGSQLLAIPLLPLLEQLLAFIHHQQVLLQLVQLIKLVLLLAFILLQLLAIILIILLPFVLDSDVFLVFVFSRFLESKIVEYLHLYRMLLQFERIFSPKISNGASNQRDILKTKAMLNKI